MTGSHQTRREQGRVPLGAADSEVVDQEQDAFASFAVVQ
jgi:hypothetical protein